MLSRHLSKGDVVALMRRIKEEITISLQKAHTAEVDKDEAQPFLPPTSTSAPSIIATIPKYPEIVAGIQDGLDGLFEWETNADLVQHSLPTQQDLPRSNFEDLNIKDAVSPHSEIIAGIQDGLDGLFKWETNADLVQPPLPPRQHSPRSHFEDLDIIKDDKRPVIDTTSLQHAFQAINADNWDLLDF